MCNGLADGDEQSLRFRRIIDGGGMAVGAETPPIGALVKLGVHRPPTGVTVGPRPAGRAIEPPRPVAQRIERPGPGVERRAAIGAAQQATSTARAIIVRRRVVAAQAQAHMVTVGQRLATGAAPVAPDRGGSHHRPTPTAGHCSGGTPFACTSTWKRPRPSGSIRRKRRAGGPARPRRRPDRAPGWLRSPQTPRPAPAPPGIPSGAWPPPSPGPAPGRSVRAW